MKFKVWRDPYGEGNLCKAKEIEIKEGITVLVGCNGSGKSTLLMNMRDECKANNIPVIYWNNTDHYDERGSALFHGDYTFAATSMCSSEGENISLNLGVLARDLRDFIFTGQSPEYKSNFFASLRGDDKKVLDSCDDRVLLLDAIDSGYSIDNVLDLKDFLDCVMKDSWSQKVRTHIVISANEYELANGEDCLDVHTGKYITFKDYNDYCDFILKSRKIKDKRTK